LLVSDVKVYKDLFHFFFINQRIREPEETNYNRQQLFGEKNALSSFIDKRAVKYFLSINTISISQDQLRQYGGSAGVLLIR
jgi:hypothetical protein